MMVKREAFLERLESVSPGLAARELIQQSSCFVFKGGKVYTYNDEVACSTSVPLDVEGAVPAKPLLELLGKLGEEELDITSKDGRLHVKGKGRRAEIIMEAQIVLPTDLGEDPDSWTDFPGDALEALSVVQEVAATSKDADFALTCVHVHPEYVEACDNFQACRFPVNTGVKNACLVRQSSVKDIPSLGVTKIAEGKSWLHFENEEGLRISARRWAEDYQDLTGIFDCAGSPITLPGGLNEAVEKANIFSSDNSTNGEIAIRIKDGKMLIRGEGTAGKFEEQRKVDFDGEIAFLIPPKILVKVTSRANQCLLSQGRLKIESGGFTYVTCLGDI